MSFLMQFLQPRHGNKVNLFRNSCENVQAGKQAKISETSLE